MKFDKVFDYYKDGDSVGILCPNSDVLVLGIKDLKCRIERSIGVIFAYNGKIKGFFKYLEFVWVQE